MTEVETWLCCQRSLIPSCIVSVTMSHSSCPACIPTSSSFQYFCSFVFTSSVSLQKCKRSRNCQTYFHYYCSDISICGVKLYKWCTLQNLVRHFGSRRPNCALHLCFLVALHHWRMYWLGWRNVRGWLRPAIDVVFLRHGLVAVSFDNKPNTPLYLLLLRRIQPWWCSVTLMSIELLHMCHNFLLHQGSTFQTIVRMCNSTK